MRQTEKNKRDREDAVLVSLQSEGRIYYLLQKTKGTGNKKKPITEVCSPARDEAFFRTKKLLAVALCVACVVRRAVVGGKPDKASNKEESKREGRKEREEG